MNIILLKNMDILLKKVKYYLFKKSESPSVTHNKINR